MKKVIFAIATLALFGISSCVVEDNVCECQFGDYDTCVDSVNLGTGCSNDCDWDVLTDCDAFCYDAGYTGGSCGNDGSLNDDCLCF